MEFRELSDVSETSGDGGVVAAQKRVEVIRRRAVEALAVLGPGAVPLAAKDGGLAVGDEPGDPCNGAPLRGQAGDLPFEAVDFLSMAGDAVLDRILLRSPRLELMGLGNCEADERLHLAAPGRQGGESVGRARRGRPRLGAKRSGRAPRDRCCAARRRPP